MDRAQTAVPVPPTSGRIATAHRVAVLSDLHGNAPALRAVLAEIACEGVDAIVFGGDLTWGSQPREMIALLSGLALPGVFVRGNADRALAGVVERLARGAKPPPSSSSCGR